MQRINIKIFMGIFSISMLVLFLMNVSVALLQESDRVGKVGKNASNRYLVSVLQDQDLNLNNQVLKSEKWLSSITGNYPDLHSWGGIIAWIPFYAYVVVLGLLGLTDFNCVVDQVDFAQALSAIFCFIVLFINIFNIQKIFESKSNTVLLLAIFSLSTPVWWYVLVEPSGPQIFYLAVLSMLLLYMLSVKKENPNALTWAISGALSYILVVISSAAYVTFFALFLYVIFLKIKKMILSKECFFYIAGIVGVFIFEALNSRIKFGHLVTLLDFISSDVYRNIPQKLMIYDSLLGSNGILYMFPSYLLSIVGLMFFNYEMFAVKKIKNNEVFLVLALSLAAMVGYFLSIYYWLPERDFLGAGLFEGQLILGIGFVYFFKEKKLQPYKIFSLLGLFIWSFIATASYYVDRNTLSSRINLDHLRWVFGSIKQDVDLIINNYSDTFKHSIWWFPLIFFIIYFLNQIFTDFKKWKIFIKGLAIYILLSFVLISLLNGYQNLRVRGGFSEPQKDQVTSEDIKMFSYMQYIDFLQQKLELAIKSNKKEIGLAIKYKIIEYNKAVVANLKTKLPDVLNLDSALEGGSLLNSDFEKKIINRQKYICNINADKRLN